ncbi:MAG: NADP-dependent oxidoreductase [Ktedonobacteraceae bacterium]|nr:NADP-dependent oxidoreductase [Ktedonobacteraceae bacterium]
MNMRAFVLTRYGGPDAMEFRDVPRPSPSSGEVLIQVYAVGLNPVDFKIRQGMLRVISRYPLPIIAGCELSGVVVARGSGVRSLAEGDRVFTRVDKKRLGAFAEFAVVREELVARMPSSVDFTTAAGVPLAGLTALQALRDELRVTRGQNIFISGGSGGVGTFAIQLGKWLGAHIATTASARGEEMVRKLGADIVVDYTREHFDQVLRQYDGALDLVGGDTLLKTFEVVKRDAKVVSIAGVPEPQTASKDLQAGPTLATLFWAASWRIRCHARKHGVTYRYLFMRASGTDLSELATLIDQQKLEIVIDRIVPFAHIADAFAYLERGHAKGKVVVQMVDQ